MLASVKLLKEKNSFDYAHLSLILNISESLILDRWVAKGHIELKLYDYKGVKYERY